jgi:hypothetical protein
VLTRAIFLTGQILVTGPQRVIELPLVRPLQETGLVPGPGPNLPQNRIMYMPEETGMYTEEIIMAMFSSEAMVSGVVADLPDPEIVQEVSKM